MDNQPVQQEQPKDKTDYGKGYGKRPLWQWILLYVIVGAIVYGAIYYFVFAKNGGYNSDNANYNYNTNSNYNYNYNTNTSNNGVNYSQ